MAEQTQDLCFHLLNLHFPATQLLPPGRQPFLEVPKDIGYREKPALGSYHLSDSSLDFFARSATRPSQTVPDPPHAKTSLSACVSRLVNAPGVSDLSAVSVIGDDDIVTRFCLNTTWFTTDGKVEEG
ncbi:hypothetical protein LTR37_014244 [Vermiconidia calcicola]|uniref:Uncharacterized protein n=1 Tax=Vermiconidia calcicola TaxID=1690605 RepID=A0ACC3MUB5_9PEZI|nr:hypothetical protein LTR37_014244 [Vermiconidia calcicola]